MCMLSKCHQFAQPGERTILGVRYSIICNMLMKCCCQLDQDKWMLSENSFVSSEKVCVTFYLRVVNYL